MVTDPGGVIRRGLIYLEDRNGDTPVAGVQVKAQAASQILRFALGESRPIAVLPGVWTAVLLAVWGVAGGLLTWRTRGFPAFAAFSALGMLACLGLAIMAISYGWWIPSAAP